LENLVENIFKQYGSSKTVGVSSTFLSNDASKVWCVLAGKINLSSTRVLNNEPIGKVQDFATLKEGDVFFGISLDSYNSLCFLVSPQEETTLCELDLNFLKEHVAKDSETHKIFQAILLNWLSTLFRSLEDGFSTIHPEADIQFKVGQSEKVEKNTIITSYGQIVWCETDKPKAFRYNDLAAVNNLNQEIILPVSRKIYVRITEESEVSGFETEGVHVQTKMWNGLMAFHQVVIEIQSIRFKNEEESETQRLINKHRRQEEDFNEMLEKAKVVLTSSDEDIFNFEIQNSNNLFFDALQIVAKQYDTKLVLPPNLNDAKNPMEEISRFSQVRYREVSLEGKWYKKDNGPFVCFYGKNYEPVAVINGKGNQYLIINPATKEKTIVNSENVENFAKVGFMLYKPLPADIKGIKQILSFCLSKDKSDYYFFILLGFCVSILGLAAPFFTSFIFDNIIVNVEKKQLLYVGLAIAMSGLAAFLFEISKSFALIRIESKMNNALQAGMWDRMLNLPTTFFTQYTAGDLANRSLGVNQIRKVLSGAVITSLLAGVFSIINLIFLFYYSVPLALVAVLIVAIQISVNVYFARTQIRKQKILASQRGKLDGIVLQLLTGITKFKVSGTEQKAFAQWFNHYLPIKDTVIGLTKTQNSSTLFNSYFQAISTMVIFVLMANHSSKESSMTLGQFLSFNASYGIFFASMLGMTSSLMSVFNVMPLFERAKPILETPTENNSTKEAPKTLKGGIEFSQINFSYEKGGQQILTDINIKINSGEYVAFVGPSGSGKSTLIRLILGFNAPDSGTIYFDGQNFNNVDPRMVRQQIGVVLQNGSLFSGDIYKNITGASGNLTIDHAWEAAKLAAFDEDVKKMPMGMHTVVSESGSTISGGQKQRLMIARALVHKPKILIFDEATSALDNRTQAIVTKSLDQLEVTRIVVAHRLSTIKSATTIYYLEAGRIVEKGSYEDLMNAKGKFYELAHRQIE